MKKVPGLVVLALGCFCVNAPAAEKLTGNEGLAIQKDGVADKAYTQIKPTLKIAAYNIGKNEIADNVTDFTALNTAIKKY